MHTDMLDNGRHLPFQLEPKEDRLKDLDAKNFQSFGGF